MWNPVNSGRVNGIDANEYLKKDNTVVTGTFDVQLFKDTTVDCHEHDDSQWCDADSDNQYDIDSNIVDEKYFLSPRMSHERKYITKDAVHTIKYKFEALGAAVINNALDLNNEDYKKDNGVCSAFYYCYIYAYTPEARAKLERAANFRRFDERDVPDYADADNWGPVALITFVMVTVMGFVGVVFWLAIARCMEYRGGSSGAGMHGITSRML